MEYLNKKMFLRIINLFLINSFVVIFSPVNAADKPFAGQTIRVIHDKRPNTENLLKIVPEFEKETGIKVKIDIMPESELFGKVQIELSQEVGTYDVIQYIWLFQPSWERAGWMIDLNPYINNSSKSAFGWKRSDFDDSMLGILSVNDKQLGIPFITFTNGLLYNDIIFRKYNIDIPTTIEEFEQVAKLLVDGELPNEKELRKWTEDVLSENNIPNELLEIIQSFPKDSHPMGVLISLIAALSTFYPDSKNITDERENYKNICRLIAQVPILAAYYYRHSQGLKIVPPDNSLSYAENFLNMMFEGDEKKLHPNLVSAMDTLLILHADHEQNCSASVMRNVGSS